MAIQQLLLYLRQYSAPLLFITFVAYVLHNKYNHGINQIPGPSLAALTDLWRLIIVWKRRPELEHIKLHQKYGPVVRLGPETVSVADPEAIKVIYALNAGFVKASSLSTAYHHILMFAPVRLLPCPANRSQRPRPPQHVQHNRRNLPREAPSSRL